MPPLALATITRIATAWREQAGAGADEPASCIVPSRPDRRMAPPGWVGFVSIGSEVIVSAPGGAVPELRRCIGEHLDASLTELSRLHQLLGPIDDVLGPAVLLYAERMDASVSDRVSLRCADSATLRDLTDTCTADEVAESGIASPDGVALGEVDGHIAGACCYRAWPGDIAHMCVLTAPRFRGTGVAVALARAGASNALRAGMIPQWRAAVSNEASVRTGLRAGFVQVGRQLSVKVAGVA